MLNIESIKDCSYSDIVANVDDYIKIFLDNGLVCFKQIYLSALEQEHVVDLFAKKLKWNYVQSTHTEDHNYTISMRDKILNKDEIIIDWHIEHLKKKYSQVAASWNMKKFTCPKGHGNTGFIDSSYLYSLMPDDWQEFLRSIVVTHITMNFPHRKCVIKHRNSGKNILRLIPDFGEDLLISVNDNDPSDEEFLFFNQIKQWYSDQIRNNESVQMWWQWDEGDFIIIDLLYIIHCVKGGFTQENRQFTRNWAFAKKSDFLKYA